MDILSLPIVLDIETKYRFQDVNRDLRKLGISVVGIYDYRNDIFETYVESELSTLFPKLEKASLIVGFNIRSFDIPVLAPYYLGDIRRLPVLDLLDDVEKFLGFRVALDDLARHTLGAKKTGHGLLAIEYYNQGKWDELKDYCISDVRITRDIYEYGKRENKVYFQDVRGKREIHVNWNEVSASHPIPLTLPI